MYTKFKQKRGAYRAKLYFGDEELTYTFDNGTTKVGSSVPYHKLPGRTNYREISVWWLRYAAVFYLTFSAITAYYFTQQNDTQLMMIIMGMVTALFLLVCLFGLSRRTVGITSFLMSPPLSILHDGQEKLILDEIATRRLAMMKQKMGQVDTTKPYYEEAGRFSWLREEGVLDEQEYKAARQKIAAMRKGGMPRTPGYAH